MASLTKPLCAALRCLQQLYASITSAYTDLSVLNMSTPVSVTARCLIHPSRPSLAAAFLQHCQRMLPTATRTSSAIETTCNFLLTAESRSYSTKKRTQSKLPAPRGSIPRSRPFSTTSPDRATAVLQNPRTDDDGHAMTIDISSRAATVRTMMT